MIVCSTPGISSPTLHRSATAPDRTRFCKSSNSPVDRTYSCSASQSVTWGTAFADDSYTVLASVQDSTATSLSLSVVHVETKSATQVQVRVLNNAAGALTGTLQILAVHD